MEEKISIKLTTLQRDKDVDGLTIPNVWFYFVASQLVGQVGEVDYGVVRMVTLWRMVGESGSGSAPFPVSNSGFDL